MDFFRDKRPFVIFFILFTLLGGVVAGIICVKNEICDFGTAYKDSLSLGACLAAIVLGFTRFGFLFNSVAEFMSSDYVDSHINAIDFLAIFRLIAWLALLFIIPIIGLVLLPADIIMTIILSIYDIVEYKSRSNAKTDTNSRKKTKNGVSDEAAETQPRNYISKITDLTANDVNTLCEIVDKSAKTDLRKLKKRSYRFLGNISHKQSNGDLHMYFVYKITYAEKGKLKDAFYALFFKNLYRKNDGALGFEGDEPHHDFFWNIMVRVKDESFPGVYPSIGLLCSRLSENGELDSNFIDL